MEITLKGGGLREALTVSVGVPDAPKGEGKDLSPLLKALMRKADVPRDPTGVPYSKPSVTGTAG